MSPRWLPPLRHLLTGCSRAYVAEVFHWENSFHFDSIYLSASVNPTKVGLGSRFFNFVSLRVCQKRSCSCSPLHRVGSVIEEHDSILRSCKSRFASRPISILNIYLLSSCCRAI